ncbi:MAG TPA: rRNA maturation RNase YbeY [Deltaproteobacteria bacterium]|nr:rRNA maturation RNase YbeY [Deltaproteobacteria bacterium]
MTILIENRQKRIEISSSKVRQDINSALKLLDSTGLELSVLFVDDEEIAELNRQYLNRNGPTNVIAFSMREGDFGEINPHVLGDIIISVDTALRDAAHEGLSFEDELTYLIIHGLLHLLGYDHEMSDEGTRTMRETEKELFLHIKGYEIE